MQSSSGSVSAVTAVERKRMSKAGFTMLDIMIVITFVALLAGVTFPRIADVQSRFAVRGSVVAFMSAHSLARATAVREGRVAELHIDSLTNRFWVEVDTTVGGTGVMDTVGTLVDVAGQGVTMTSTQSLLCFESRGMPSSASGCATGGAKIVFSYENVTDTIATTALGKILR